MSLLIIALSAIPFSSKPNIETPHIEKIITNIPDSLTRRSSDIASYINYHYTDSESKAKAIYFWIANNISYDKTDTREWFYLDEIEEYVQQTLNTKQGKCQAYAELFKDLCIKTGIEANVVPGLFMSFDKILEKHTWIAVVIDSCWKLIDPTFAAGYCLDEEFFNAYDESYFDVDPLLFIKSHYPFDPLWQMLEYPVNFREFYQKDYASRFNREYFSYKDSINSFCQKDNLKKILEEKQRVENYGDDFIFIDDYLQITNRNAELLEHQNSIEVFNQCITIFNYDLKQFGYIEAIIFKDTAIYNQFDILNDLKKLEKNLTEIHKKLKSLIAVEETMVWKIIYLKYQVRSLIVEVQKVIREFPA